MMANFVYSSLVIGVLLFPWSVVGFMVAGAVWQRLKVGARARR